MSRLTQFNSQKRKNAQPSLPDNRVVFYIRASTLEQVNSLDAQAIAGKSFADAKGLNVVKTFTDAGESALKKPIRTRPQAGAMFKFMKAQGISRALFIRPNRAFRNTLDFCQTSEWMQEQGFAFMFTNPDIDSSTRDGKMMLHLLVMVAEMECETKADAQDATYESLRQRRVARSNHAPYGWEAGEDSTTIRRGTGTPLPIHHPIPAEQAVLRHIMAMWESGQGKHGLLTHIARDLNTRHIPTKMAGKQITRGGRTTTASGIWEAATVKSVLAHALLATDSELPHPLTLEQATTILTKSPAAA